MIEFDPIKHEYKVDGVIRPSVTQIIHDCLPIYDKAFKPCHSDRGHAVHIGTQLLEQGKLDWDSVHPSILPYIKAWERFLADTSAQSIDMEKQVYNADLCYAGTLDRVIRIGKDIGVLDIKTGNSITADIQTAGYDMALPGPFQIRWACTLTKEGKYKLVKYDNLGDYDTFLALTKVWYYKRRKGL